MHRPTFFALLGLGLVTTLSPVVSCSGSSSNNAAPTNTDGGAAPTDTAPTGVSVSAVCGTVCSRKQACDPKADVDTCKAECANNNTVFVSKINDAYASKVQACIAETACREFDNADPFARCHAEAKAGIAPSVKASSFCDDYQASATKCGATLDKASCLEGQKIFSDAAFDEAQKCFAKPCPDINACVQATFGGTSIRTTPGPTPPVTPPPVTPPAPTSCNDVTFGITSTACLSCARTSCCSAMLACAQDTGADGCGRLVECFKPCPINDTACYAKCMNAADAAAESQFFSTLYPCLEGGGCAATCGISRPSFP